jgi:hypothetical protein
MPILVEIIDERGVRQGEPWDHARSGEFLSQATSGTCCLRFIDPYGDATFNQLQLPVLLDELAAYCTALPDGELAAVGTELVAFLQQAVDQVHVYVRFVGD